MKNRYENKHMVDILFVLALFVVFAISALMLVILGADVYKKTVTSMDKNFEDRTATSYIVEKIRQADQADSIRVTDLGDGEDALCIVRRVGENEYHTLLYVYDHSLCELSTRGDATPVPEYGTKLFSLDNLTITKESEHLFTVTVTQNQTTKTVQISTATAQ